MADRFAGGAEVVVREVLHDAEWASWREQVVSDEDVLATVQREGTALAFPPHPVPHPWGHLAAWQGTTMLKLRREGDWYSVWKFFDASGFLSWYVNFETPYVRRADGVDINDLQLDLVITPGGDRRWKDVEHLAPCLDSGRITLDETLHVLHAAADVAALLERDERWWAPWDDWAPSELSRRVGESPA